VSTLLYSNTKFIEVLDPLPLENIGWYCKVLSETDYATVIAEVSRFAELTFQKEQSGVGGGSISLDMGDPLWSAALPLGQTVPIRDQQAVWQVLDDGIPRFAFFAEDVQEDVVKDGVRTCVISGRGIGSCLEWSVVLPEGYPSFTSTERAFGGAAMGGFLTLLTEAQARGELDWVTTSFTATVDSRGEPWATDQTLIASAGATLLDVLNAWCEQTGAAWKMLPGFQLWIEQTQGNHREDTMVFALGGEQVDHGKKKSRREISNNLYVYGPDQGVSTAADATSISKWRKRSKWLEAGQAGDTTARDQVAMASLALLAEQKVQREVKVVPDRAGRRIFVDYDVADWITIEAEEGDGDASQVQVKAATIKVDANNNVDLELAVGSRFDAMAVALQRMLNKMGAQSVSGSASAVPITPAALIAATRLRDLADVNTVTAGAGDVLRFDGTNWVDDALILDDLADVDLTGLADGDVPVWDEASSLWKPGAGGGGGGGVLTPVVDLPLSTLTGWTVESGTWAIAGGVLQLSTAGASAQRVLRFNTRLATAVCIVEVDVRVVSGSGSYQRASVGVAEISAGGTSFPVVHLLQTNDSGATWQVGADQKDVTARGSTTIAGMAAGYGVWKTCRVVFVGDAATVYVNGVLAGNFTNLNSTANGYENQWFTLGGYNSVSEFRNLKVWDAGSLLQSGGIGTPGIDGIDGRTLLNGAGTPSAGTGADGDFYIDTNDPKTIYGPKTAGAWGSGTSIVGPAGADGSGVPAGGSTGQVLAKASATDGDVTFIDPPVALPAGGTTGQVLAKASDSDQDVEWATVSGGTVSSGVEATGGNSTYDLAGYRYHVFTSSGTLTVTAGGLADGLIVGGGGGGGGNGGGGGGGAVKTITPTLTPTSYSIVVGAGGVGGSYTGGVAATAGGDSSFAGTTSGGGGRGGLGGGAGAAKDGGSGSSGGSGGGGARNGGAAGSGSSPGYSGGTASTSTSGGGGGAGAAGANAATNAGNGGSGIAVWGANYGGGGGGGVDAGGGSGGTGGLGGGGAGAPVGVNAGTAGAANTGGGGGGGGGVIPCTGGAGGSGVVVVRYALPESTGPDSSSEVIAARMFG
jgi:hypothetical protein